MHTSPRSHYTLPSGDEIPSVAFGASAPQSYLVYRLIIHVTGVGRAGKGEVGQAVKAALAAGYRHIDGAWAYGVRIPISLWGIHPTKTSARRTSEKLDRRSRRVGSLGRTSSSRQRYATFRGLIFLMTKPPFYQLWNSRHAPEDIEPSVDQSLSDLQTSYLDLHLIHWYAPQSPVTVFNVDGASHRPIAFKKERVEGKYVVDEALTADPYPTWKKLEELVDKGKIRNIGISK